MKLVIALVVVVLVAIAALAASTEATGLPPTATTGQATTLGACSAAAFQLRFDGSVDPGGQDTTWYFEYGDDVSYGAQTPAQDAGAGTAGVAVSQTIPGRFGTTHFRLVAINASGPSYGADQAMTFFVPPCPPPPVPDITVSAGPLTPNRSFCATPGPTSLSVVLTVTDTPVSSPADSVGSASVHYGPTTAYGHQTPSFSLPWTSPAAAATKVSVRLSGLPTGAPTHYSLVIAGPGGETEQLADATTGAVPVASCPARLAGRHHVSVRWSLVHLRDHGRTATVRYRLPCAGSGAHSSVAALRHGVLSLRVLALAPRPAAQCFRAMPLTTMTVHLPHAVSRGRLHHGTVTAS